MRKTTLTLVVLLLGSMLIVPLAASGSPQDDSVGVGEAVRRTVESVVGSAPPLVGQFSAPDGATRGLTFDGEYLWSADSGDGDSQYGPMIYKLDPLKGTVIKSYQMAQGACGLTWDGWYLWHSNYLEGMIYKIDVDAWTVVHSFPAPGGFPFDLAWGCGFLYAVRGNEPNISKIHPKTGEEVEVIYADYESPNVRPFGLVYLSRGAGQLWTSDGDYGSNLVNVWDFASYAWVDQWSADPATYPSGLAYDPESGYLWVSCWDTDMIYVFDVGATSLPYHFAFEGYADEVWLWFNPDGTINGYADVPCGSVCYPAPILGLKGGSKMLFFMDFKTYPGCYELSMLIINLPKLDGQMWRTHDGLTVVGPTAVQLSYVPGSKKATEATAVTATIEEGSEIEPRLVGFYLKPFIDEVYLGSFAPGKLNGYADVPGHHCYPAPILGVLGGSKLIFAMDYKSDPGCYELGMVVLDRPELDGDLYRTRDGCGIIGPTYVWLERMTSTTTDSLGDLQTSAQCVPC